MRRRPLAPLIVSSVGAVTVVAFAMLVMSLVAAANPVRLDRLTAVETVWFLTKLFGVPLVLLFAAIGVLYRSNRQAAEPADSRSRTEVLGTDIG